MFGIKNTDATETKKKHKMECSLLVLGNLMLDMTAPVDENYLEMYGLIPDSIQIAEPKHLKIYEEIMKRKNVVVSPGGSAFLNTVRMTQKILSIPNTIALLGAVGSDETGKLLVETVEKEGIRMMAQFVKNVPTARCASLLTSGGSARAMVTDLGAALQFSHETWMGSAVNMELLEKAQFIYITGYFLKVSFPTVLEVAKRAKQRNVPVLLNLNAVWVTTCFTQEIVSLLPFVDILFGNDVEIASFGGELGSNMESMSTTPANMIASMLSSLLLEKKKIHETKSDGNNCIVLVTRGSLPVLCAQNGQLAEYPVPLVSKDDLVDTTCCGDAFVGGFLACFIQEKSLDECINCGIWAATEELKGYGFILPLQIPQQFQWT